MVRHESKQGVRNFCEKFYVFKIRFGCLRSTFKIFEKFFLYAKKSTKVIPQRLRKISPLFRKFRKIFSKIFMCLKFDLEVLEQLLKEILMKNVFVQSVLGMGPPKDFEKITIGTSKMSFL